MPSQPLPPENPEVSDDLWQQGEDAFPALQGSLTGDSRTEARVAAVQVLFSAHESKLEVADVAAEMLDDVKARKADKVLFAVITTEAGEGASRYDDLLRAHMLENWPLERIDPVHRALLWAAAAELTARPETPAKVVFNEYMNIAKGFSAKPDEVGFINAVLEKIAAKIRG